MKKDFDWHSLFARILFIYTPIVYFGSFFAVYLPLALSNRCQPPFCSGGVNFSNLFNESISTFPGILTWVLLIVGLIGFNSSKPHPGKSQGLSSSQVALLTHVLLVLGSVIGAIAFWAAVVFAFGFMTSPFVVPILEQLDTSSMPGFTSFVYPVLIAVGPGLVMLIGAPSSLILFAAGYALKRRYFGVDKLSNYGIHKRFFLYTFFVFGIIVVTFIITFLFQLRLGKVLFIS